MRALGRIALVVAIAGGLGACSLWTRVDLGDVTLGLHQVGHAVTGVGSHVAIRIR